MGIPKAFFSKGMGAFCRKSGGSQKRECPSPYHSLPAPRHFERSEKSSLHNGQATSVRGGAAPRRFYLSLISTEYRQGVKDPSATLSMTIREDGLSLIAFHLAPVANLRPFGAPPSRGRREKVENESTVFPHTTAFPAWGRWRAKRAG